MWVKVSSALYLNTDRVSQIIINDDEATVFIGDNPGYTILIPADAANYLLACVDVQAAQETAEPAPASLKTKIAQALRLDYPSGLTKADLHQLFFDDANNSTEIDVALGELLTQRVVIQPEGYPKTYQHASHSKTAPSTPSPDPSIEDAGS